MVSLQVLPAHRPLRQILDPFFTSYSDITICHGLPARFGKRRAWVSSNVEDEVAAQHAGSIAIASYTYARGFPPDPSAEASIRSICPKGLRPLRFR
jgi:hypothetical protein